MAVEIAREQMGFDGHGVAWFVNVMGGGRPATVEGHPFAPSPPNLHLRMAT